MEDKLLKKLDEEFLIHLLSGNSTFTENDPQYSNILFSLVQKEWNQCLWIERWHATKIRAHTKLFQVLVSLILGHETLEKATSIFVFCPKSEATPESRFAAMIIPELVWGSCHHVRCLADAAEIVPRSTHCLAQTLTFLFRPIFVQNQWQRDLQQMRSDIEASLALTKFLSSQLSSQPLSHQQRTFSAKVPTVTQHHTPLHLDEVSVARSSSLGVATKLKIGFTLLEALNKTLLSMTT